MKAWSTVPHIRRVEHGGVEPAPTRLVPAVPEVEKYPRGSPERAAAHHRLWLRHMSRTISAPGEHPPELYDPE